MSDNETIAEAMAELTRARKKFPSWPIDPLHAVAILNEEIGELNQAILEHAYEPDKSSREDVKKEALQSLCMCIRFLNSMDVYEFKEGKQHEQKS